MIIGEVKIDKDLISLLAQKNMKNLNKIIESMNEKFDEITIPIKPGDFTFVGYKESKIDEVYDEIRILDMNA